MQEVAPPMLLEAGALAYSEESEGTAVGCRYNTAADKDEPCWTSSAGEKQQLQQQQSTPSPTGGGPGFCLNISAVSTEN